MSEEGKAEIPYTTDLIRNSTHLMNLVHETAVKYQEIERAREAEEDEEQRARYCDSPCRSFLLFCILKKGGGEGGRHR